MINSNGELLSEQEAKLSVFNRGLAYGDALFETIKTLNGKILFWAPNRLAVTLGNHVAQRFIDHSVHLCISSSQV